MSAPLTDEELAGLVKICESRTRYGIPAVMMDVGLVSRALEELVEGRKPLPLPAVPFGKPVEMARAMNSVCLKSHGAGPCQLPLGHEKYDGREP